MITPNFSRIEYERRFLVTGAVPAAQGSALVTDRCIAGTRVYLRRANHADRRVERRLCKQYEPDGAICAAVAIEELSEHDYAIYAHMEAMLITKHRSFVAEQGHEVAIDVFEGALRGLVLCEIASATEAAAVAFRAPAWAREEVTGDPFFAPAALAFTTPDQLRARLGVGARVEPAHDARGRS